MVKQRNIVDLNLHRQADNTSPSIVLPQLVISAQRRAKHQIKTLLPEFFAKLDDRLFDLADKADNNQTQSLYFEAMRNVRLKKEAMEKTYFNEMVKAFRDSIANTDTNPASVSSLDQISLVDDDTLENSVAITNMASTADNHCREALFALTARFNFLIEDIEITKTNNPLRPDVFCQALIPAVECLDLDIKVRLVIYKLFDQQVIQQLGAMYNAINADLVSAGVLPRIKSTIQKSDDSRPTTYSNRAAPTEGSLPPEHDQLAGDVSAATTSGYFDGNHMLPEIDPNQPEALFSSLQELLSMSRSGVPGGNAAPGNISGNINAGGTGNGSVMPGQVGNSAGMVYYAPQDVVSALSALQSGNVNSLTDDREQASAAVIKDIVIKQISRDSDNAEDRQIDQNDTDAIDIVSMLFDFILDDPSLSDHIKAQIARLQIPMLKVAILDKTFFARKTHPARHLLNEMAYAGGTLDENDPNGDATYQMVKYIVDRVQDEFEEDTSLFDVLLEEFTHFIEKERESNKLAEEMLEQARDTVAREIQRRITDNQVPPLVNNILITAWKDVLTHLFLRDGEESTAWNTALQVADDLIWSIQPKIVVVERQRLIKVIPRVLNGLRDGLTLIRYDIEATDQLFAGLETLHIASLRGSAIEMDDELGVQDEQFAHGAITTPSQNPVQADTEQMVEALLSDDDFGMNLSDADNLPDVTDSISMNTQPGAQHDELDEDDIMEEIVLTSAQNLPWDQITPDNDFEAEIKEMALGTWVEFIDGETERRRRGKLAWKCDFTGEYTFVDRKYKVVADMSFNDLMEEFKLERASVVDDVPLFDRALDSVIGGIKHALTKNTEPTLH